MEKIFEKTEFTNVRCSICNSVSHAEIADEFGEFSPNSFYELPEGGFVCSPCYQEYADMITEWELEEVVGDYEKHLEYDDDCY